MLENKIECLAFTAGQAARASAVEYHNLNHWAKTGFVVPSLAEADGMDTCRAYSFGDVVALAMAKRLRDAGLGLDAIRSVVAHLQQREYTGGKCNAVLVGSDDGSVVECDTKSAISALKNRRFGWVMDAGSVVAEMRAALKNARAPKRGKARCVQELVNT